METNNHFVQSFSLGISVKRISVLCFEYFASFLDVTTSWGFSWPGRTENE
ncbi:hypothetical protein Avbf_18532 [Armadillidium vulgare]|nr:hypothetical protein Avbf_18532 [Armadillidium vulgare]